MESRNRTSSAKASPFLVALRPSAVSARVVSQFSQSHVPEEFNFPLFVFTFISIENKSPISSKKFFPGLITCWIAFSARDGGKNKR